MRPGFDQGLQDRDKDRHGLGDIFGDLPGDLVESLDPVRVFAAKLRLCL